jgi:hypothetical protein
MHQLQVSSALPEFSFLNGRRLGLRHRSRQDDG